MRTLLAANAYLDFENPDMEKVYLLLAAIAAIYIAMSIFRGIGRLRERRDEKKSAWQTFRKMARARGLTAIEIRVLSRAASQAEVKRPAQLLASIQLFDRCVTVLTETSEVSTSDQAHIDSARRKLVTKAEVWDRKENRRQLERADASLPIQLLLVAEDKVDEKVKVARLKEGEREEERIEEVWGDLVKQVAPAAGQIVTFSAGGVSLIAQPPLDIQGADYLQFIRTGEDLPLDLDGLLGQIVAVESKAGEGKEKVQILHIRFLPYPQEKRKEIIQLVYAAEESAPRAKQQAQTQTVKQGKPADVVKPSAQ